MRRAEPKSIDFRLWYHVNVRYYLTFSGRNEKGWTLIVTRREKRENILILLISWKFSFMSYYNANKMNENENNKELGRVYNWASLCLTKLCRPNIVNIDWSIWSSCPEIKILVCNFALCWNRGKKDIHLQSTFFSEDMI